jgi:hypothetical protein
MITTTLGTKVVEALEKASTLDSPPARVIFDLASELIGYIDLEILQAVSAVVKAREGELYAGWNR